VTWHGWLIYYLLLAGIGLSAVTQILNFAASWPPNRRRWAGLTLGIITAAALGVAAFLGREDLQWRRVSKSQEAILSKQLEGTDAVGYFMVLNHQDPEQGQYFASIAGVCIKIKIVCYLAPQKMPYPAFFPPVGMLFFAFDNSDQRVIKAFGVAGLITGTVGTSVGTDIFPDGIRAGIIIGPKPSPLGPESWRTNAPEPR
jgi:hypothetical protein